MHALLVLSALGGLAATPPQDTVSHAYLGVRGINVPKRGGVEILGTDPGSPASDDVRPGDILLFWDGLPVRTILSLFERVESRAPGDHVMLQIRRGTETLQVPVELADAARLCQEGIGVACARLGARYHHFSFDEGYEFAAKLYERACELGSSYGCSSLGIMYFFGHGLPKDHVRSTALYAKACEAEDSYGCLALGEAYLDGDGIEADEARGVELLKWACDHEQSSGCSTLGLLYETGRKVPADRTAAAEYYRLACEDGWTHACEKWWYLQRPREEETREIRTIPRATPELNEALFRAVEARDPKELQRLLEAGADPSAKGDIRDLHGIPVIVGALFLGELDMVHALLDAGADVQGKESNPFQTPLTAAIARGDLTIVNRMLELGAKVHSGDLGQAAGSSTPEVMRRLLEEGITVEDLYLGTMPAIMEAAREKEYANIEFLIAQGADIDALDENDKHNALTYVLDEGDAETATFLLERGADPNMTDAVGMAPLHYAAGKGMVETVEVLLEHGADPDNVNDQGMSILQLAVMTRNVEVVRALVEGGASAGKPDPDGATPLMYAAALGDDAICEILLKGGAPVNVVAKKGYLAGQSALAIARLAGYEDIVKRLIAAGAGDPI